MIDPNVPRTTPDESRGLPPRGVQRVPRTRGAGALAIVAAIVVALIIAWALFAGGGETTTETTAPAAVEGMDAPAPADATGTAPAVTDQQ